MSSTVTARYRAYSQEDKQACKDLLEELKQKQIEATLLDVVRAVEPDLETPEHLAAA